MNKIKVLLEAPILTLSGYGIHSRLVFESLKDNSNLDIHIAPLLWGTTSWIADIDPEIENGIRRFHEYNNFCKTNSVNPEYDLQIHVGIPNEFNKKGKFSVMVTAGIETDRVAWSWILKTHQGIDKIIVPSQHSKEVYRHTTYEVINKQNNTKTEINAKCPIEAVPYPVREVASSIKGLDLETDFNFLNIGLLGPRKNMEQCIEWFIKEFQNEENVGLVLKTGRSRGSLVDRQHTLRAIKEVTNKYPEKKCKIYLLHGNMSNEEIHALYVHPKIKALVTTTHGEGFGLPIFESVYSGLPVVATNWSGHLDFLSAPVKNKKNGKIKDKSLFAQVEYDLRDIPPAAVWEEILVQGSRWAYPQELSFKTQIRKVYKNYSMYKSWAKKLQAHILESHELSKILDKMSSEILETVPSEIFEKITEPDNNIDDVMVFE